MVSGDINAMYDKIIEYSTKKGGYLTDPSSADIEIGDLIGGMDLGTVIAAIQTIVSNRPTIREAALMKSYRDLRSTQAEYDIRLMSRSDYFKDAALEEEANKNKWIFNKKIRGMQMNGKGAGA